MSARDELQKVIFGYFGPTLKINAYRTPEQQDRELAEAILAAGYRKPRTITTAEELYALPVGSVVAMIGSEPDSPAVACRAVRGWQFLGDDPERRYLSSSLMPSPEPITVLHEPEATA